MECRIGCAACCIVISISSPIPGMPNGKPAGVPCANLTADKRCGLFGKPERPAVCGSLPPSLDMCGTTNEEAYAILSALEQATRPRGSAASSHQPITPPAHYQDIGETSI